MKKNVWVIGGGASGMMAAITAAETGAQVTIAEHTDRVGKKILSTGNGRCNLTNLYQDSSCYRSSQADFPAKVLKQFSVEKTVSFFERLGIVMKDRNGYLYPNSDQASSVLDVLREEIERKNIRVLLGCEIQDIRKQKDEFQIVTSQGTHQADAVILAAGSKAAPVTGSDGSGYRLAEKLGHRIITPLPALVQLRCAEKHYKQISGIRTDARVSIYTAGKDGAWKWETEDRGELQLTDYGISGIPVFQVSRYASVALHNKKNVKAVIDFFPQLNIEETRQMMQQRRAQLCGRSAEGFMTGMLNKKLSVALLKLAKIAASEPITSVDNKRFACLIRTIKQYETVITATNPYENAQICCGGVDTREIDSATMESKKVKGLYFAGEIVDVDGICGGYNLQWAWSSGAVAGRNSALVKAGRDVAKKKRNETENGHERQKGNV